MVRNLFGTVFRGATVFIGFLGRSPGRKLGLSFVYGEPGVVNGIAFVIAPKVSDPLDHYFWIVTAGEGALRICPVMFGLAFVVVGKRAPSFLGLAKVPRCFGRIFVDREIAERVDRIAFLPRLDDEFLGEFSVGESRQPQNARRIGCRHVAAELICEAMKERLCLILTEPTHFPDDLMLAWRGIEDKVRRWDFRRIP